MAAVVWALADLERFTLLVLLPAMAFPAAVLEQGGALVAVADLLVLVVLGAWLAHAAVGSGPVLFLAGNPMLAPILLFAAATAASFSWSSDRPATTKAVVQIVEIVVVVTLLFASLPASLKRIRQGLLAYVGVTTALAAVAVALFAPRAAGGDVSPQYLPGLHKNTIGAFLGVGLVLAYTLALEQRDRRVAGRWFLRLAVLVHLGGMVASFSRGAIVGALVALLVVTALLRRNRVRTVVLVGLAAGLVAAVVQPVITEGAERPGGYDSAEVRRYSYADGVEKIRDHPVLGTGAGTYWADIEEVRIGITDPNNMFLLTWAELGVAGLAALLFLLQRYGRTLLRARDLPEPARFLALAAGGAALSRFVHFQFDVTWTRGTATIGFALVGLMLASARLASREHSEQTASKEPRGRGEPTPNEPRAEPRRLRVLHVVTSPRFAGIERHVLRLCQGLAKRGVACAIACPPSAERLRAEAAAAGIPVAPRRARGDWLLNVARRLRADPPDVVHVHDGIGALVGLGLPSDGAPRLVRTQHFVQPASATRSGWTRPVSLVLHRALNRKADALVTVSESVAEAARARREAVPRKISVIPPGIELPDDEAVRAALKARRRLENPVVAFVGRLQAEKSPELLVRAIPLVLEQLPSCRFVMAGSGALEQELRRLARRLGVDAAITWTGEVDDPAPVFEAAHVFVNPSSVEGYGLATAEAMAHALPAIGVSVGGTAEIVENGVSGLLVAQAEPEALAEAILRLARDRNLGEWMGLAARRRAAELFTSKRTIDLTLALYRGVAEGRG